MTGKSTEGHKSHLAIFKKEVAEAILNGKKTIETRFSKHRIAPFGQVQVGDLVYVKPPGEDIIGTFRVKKVFFFEGLELEDIDNLFKEYGKKISSGNKEKDQIYHEAKKTSKFATFIFIRETKRLITSPIKIKKSDQRGWVVLN